MASVRQQILDAVELALNDPARPPGVPATERVRLTATPGDGEKYMLLYPINEAVTRSTRTYPVVVRSLTIRIDCRASALAEEPGVNVDSLVDDMLEWASSRLVDNRFDGLVHSVSEAVVDWSYAAADQLYVEASVEFVIQYQTLPADQSRRS